MTDLRKLNFKKNSLDLDKAFNSGGLTGKKPKPVPKWKEPNYKGYKWGAKTGN